MADALHSARTKLKRASLHTGTAEREARRFLQAHPAPTVTIEIKAEKKTIPLGGTVDADLVIERGLPDLPDSFAARFGDAIYNYRCVLDHIAWQLYKHGKTPNLGADSERAIQFPIYAKKSRFRTELATRLPGVDTRRGGPCEFIERCHRYKGGKARNRLLLGLARLSNDDKHRALHVMASKAWDAKHEITFTDCRHTAFINPPRAPELKPGAVVAHMTLVLTGRNPKVQVIPEFSGYVAVEDWGNAIDILREIRREIREIINAPEILAAVR